MKPKELFVFVTSTATIVHGGWIWDPDCLNSECVGDPLVGDGFSSFDDWTGSRKYSTKVHFTCNEGIGFDLYDDWNNAPTMIYMQCGRQCEEGTYGRYHWKAGQGTGRCKYVQGWCNPDWLYSFTPESDRIPECSIGDQEWHNFFKIDFLFFQPHVTKRSYPLLDTLLTLTATLSLFPEKRRQSHVAAVTSSKENSYQPPLRCPNFLLVRESPLGVREP